jgi:hypothetical protein
VYTAINLKKSWKFLFKNLSSARKIIQILQEVVNAKPDLGTVSTKEANSNHDLNFETMNNKLRRKKLIPKKWENNNILKLQQSQPIPPVVNKYAVLDSLQEESEAFQNYSRASVGGACSTYGGREKCVQGSGGEA